jgi:MFS transporter, ACS family, glucarate transporter
LSTSTNGLRLASDSNSPSPNGRSTHIRWLVLGLVTVIMFVDSLHRQSLGIAGKTIIDELHFTTQTMGWILSGYTLGYALFQIPWGYLGDRFGPKSILTIAVIWASLFTLSMGFAPQLATRAGIGIALTFFLLRFLVGIGVAAAPPNITKIVSAWAGTRRRGIGSSFASMGTGLGGVVAPFFFSWAIHHWGWPTPFYLCGMVGVMVAFIWRLNATNRPEEHPRVNPAELAAITTLREQRPTAAHSFSKNPPWKKMASSASVWGLLLSYPCHSYPTYVFFNWFFLYLIRERGLTVVQGSFWGATPFIATTILSPMGGWFSDQAVRRLGKFRGRQTAVWLGQGLSAILMFAGSHTLNNRVAITLLALSAGFSFFSLPTWWATCIDLSQNFSGSLSGLMNTFGNLGGWISPILTAYIATRFGWIRALDFAALITILGAILWFGVNATDDLEVADSGVHRSET